MNIDKIFEKERTHITQDNCQLYYRIYSKPHLKEKKILIIHHGIGEHSGRYTHLVNELIDTNYEIYIHDARGHGKSEGKRGHVEQFFLYLDDLKEIIGIAKKNEGVDKVTLLGHSMGGVVCALFAESEENQKNLDKLILSSIGMRVNVNLELYLKKLFAPVFSNLIPSITISTGINAFDLSHDIDEVEKYMRDPLVHSKVSFYLGYMLLKSEEVILKNAFKIQVPTYIFHGNKDNIVNYTGSIDLFDKISSKDKKIKIYENLFHETMNEIMSNRKIVLKDLKDWLLK